jgi:DNA-binding transcriptional MocR family regulator
VNGTDIYEAFREQITSGELPPGTALPPVTKISTELRVSLSRVRHAYGKLAQEKLIHASGPGYIAGPPAPA